LTNKIPAFAISLLCAASGLAQSVAPSPAQPQGKLALLIPDNLRDPFSGVTDPDTVSKHSSACSDGKAGRLVRAHPPHK
jgi:hypothetical protein